MLVNAHVIIALLYRNTAPVVINGPGTLYVSIMKPKILSLTLKE